jgi:hypothetical protein
MVQELDDEDRPIVFRKDDDGNVIVYNGRHPGNFYAFDDMKDKFRLRSGDASDFTVRSGNFSSFFPDEDAWRPFVFDVDDNLLGGWPGDGSSAEIMSLEREARRLADRIRREDGDVDELESTLDEKLNTIFELKMDARVDRMETLDEQLQTLRERIQQRRSDRDAIIRQRKEELLGRRGRYDW